MPARRVSIRWVFGSGYLALGLLFVWLARGGPANPRSADATTLVIACQQQPDTLNPVLMEMLAGYEIAQAVYDSLATFDDHWTLIPRMARELPTRANGGIRVGPDGRMQTVWHLRPDCRWADGEPVTADDFIFTHRVMLDDRVPVITRDTDRRIRRMESEDDGRTLVVTWSRPFAYATEGQRHYLLPRHIEEPIYRADPAHYADRSRANRRSVGNGPYSVGQWTAGGLVVRANPYWNGARPRVPTIAYQFCTSSDTILAGLRAGKLDAVSPVGLELDQALELQRSLAAQPRPAYQVHFRPSLYWEHIDLNLDHPILEDPRVRRALIWGMDRQSIVRLLLGGRVPVADSWLPPEHYGFNPAVIRYSFNPERAKRLLDQAGWRRGPDGIRQRADGRALRLQLRTTAGNAVRDRIAQMIQEDYRAIGVDLTVQDQEAAAFFEDVRHRRFELALEGEMMTPSEDGEGLWTIRDIPSAATNWQGSNYSGWRNREADRIDTEVPQTLDAGRRAALLRREQVLWTRDLPAIPLFFHDSITVTRAGFRGWRPTGCDTPVTWNCYEWSLAVR